MSERCPAQTERLDAEAYSQPLRLQEKELDKIDDAIATAEKMSRRPEARAEGMKALATAACQGRLAHGRVLYQMGRYAEAEPRLRQAVELGRSEKRLLQLSEVLGRLGRKEEAARFAGEAKVEFAETIKRGFINQPAKDFELTAIDGRRLKLSDLKGKAVMVDFWATWCGPCVAAMPHLVKLYEKYKSRGLEILAISCDDKADRHLVAPFAKEHKVTFPVLFDEGVGKLYNVRGYPTSIFIDKQGHIRYRDMGFRDETPRELEVIFDELLK